MIESPLVDVEYLGEKFAKGLSSLISERISHATTPERAEMEDDWVIFLNWAKGKPYARRNARGELEMIKVENRKNYHHKNLIAPRLAVLVGHTTYIPRFEANHGSSFDIDAVMRARATQDAANHAIRAADFYRAFVEANNLAHHCGHAWIYNGWDPTRGGIVPKYGFVQCPKCAGMKIVIDAVGAPAPCDRCGAEGGIFGVEMTPDPGQVVELQGQGPEGEVCSYAVPPWEVYPDPEAPSLFECQWLVHVKDMPKSKALELFAEGSGLTEDDISTGDQGTLANLFQSTHFSRNAPAKREYVSVQQYWQLPTKKHPKGVFAVKIGDKVVSGGRLRFAHLKLPYVPVRCHVKPDSIYPQGTVERLLPVAVAFNDHFTNLHQRAHWTSSFHLVSPTNNGFRLSDKPGVLEYDWKPGRPGPQELQKQGVSSDTIEMLNRLNQDADEISFVNEVLRGDANFESARLAAFVDERASVPLKMLINDQAVSVTLCGRMLVDVIKDFYEPGRVFELFGPNGSGYVSKFLPDKMGRSEDVDLYAQRDLGRSVSLKRQELIEAKKGGLLDDPRLFKMAEFAGDPALYADRRRHESTAMAENDRVRAAQDQGQITGMEMGPPHLFEDHDIHIETHGSFLDEMRAMYGAQSPQAMMVEQHMLGHKEMQAQEMARDQMAIQNAASAMGMVNAADPAAQPASTPQSAADAGMTTGADPTENAPPGPPESQPGLQQVDAAFTQGA